MQRTVLQETHDAAPVLRVADGGVGADSDLMQAGVPVPEVVAAIVHNCVREKQNAMRRHGREALLPALRHGLIMLVLFGTAHVLSGFTMPYVFAIVLVSFLFDFVMELFATPLWSTALQRQTALSLNAITPDDPRTIVALLDALPRIPMRLCFPYHFRRADYETLFPALAALWNAGDDLALTLTDTRRARLRGTLNALYLQGRDDGDLTTGEADFCAAAIKALAVTGDTKTKRLLKQIAAGDALGENRAFVRSLAADVLPLLTERVAENTAHTKAFRAIVDSKNRVVDLLALHNFSRSVGEARMQAVAQNYLQTANHSYCLRCAVVSLLLSGALALFLCAVLLLQAGAYFYPFALLSLAVAILVQSRIAEAASENDKTRMRLVVDHATRTGSAAIVPDLLDLLAQQKWRHLRDDKLLVVLNALQPGDGVFLGARHLAFLRGAVRNRSAYAKTGGWATAFADAAIHALGIAGDVGVKRELEHLLSDLRPENAPLRAAAFDALVRINAAQESDSPKS